MPLEDTRYDDQTSEWQSGYDDFYAWEGEDDEGAGIEQYANAPKEENFADCVMRTSSLGSQVVCARCGVNCECYVCTHDVSDFATASREYHSGWRHGNYENAYIGYRVAVGGLTDS